VIRIAAILFAVFMFAGCEGVRVTDAQAVQLSQARSDVIAARMTTDAAARSALFQAACARLKAGMNDLDLPPAPVPPTAFVAPDGSPIMGAIEKESNDARSAEADPPAGWGAVIAATAGGLGLMVLSVLRLSPGAFGLVANIAHTILAPKATKDMRAVQAKATDVAEQAIAYGHAVTQAAKDAGLGDEVAAIQARAIDMQNAIGIRPQIKTLLERAKGGAIETPSPVPAITPA
jgi:hypothetical protein